jgi:hypothetical protein
MKDKSLKSKAIKIKGKDYVEVKNRVLFFNENYLNGCIQTFIEYSDTKVRAKAVVIPDTDKPALFYTGHSQEDYNDSGVNSKSATENAETSAVGRALAMMGIGVLDSIASVDELAKAGVLKSVSDVQNRLERVATNASGLATERQINYIARLQQKAHVQFKSGLTVKEAGEIIGAYEKDRTVLNKFIVNTLNE